MTGVQLVRRLFAPNRAHSILLVLAGAFLAWEVAVLIFKPPIFLLPPPSLVLGLLLDDIPFYANHARHTLGACLFGFAVALVVGVFAAVGIVYSRVLENTLYTLLVALNSIPKIALAPLFIIWMGSGTASRVAISATIALWAIVIDTVLGLRSVDPEMLDMARSMRATRLQVLYRIRLPNALPSLFAGMKVAISMALVGVIVGEFVTSEAGLGYTILSAQGTFNIPMVFVAIILLGVLGTVLFYAVDLIERLVIPWHVSHRGGAAAPTTTPSV
ncbi:MAG: ABC transporter permease [Alphaproteobacteria bacterium]|nr:ABC transporter permease [Alphaproteobacteria bacterium]